MKTPVKFEIAKLLKEKGLDIEKQNFYNSHGQLNTDIEDFFIPRYEAPTIAEVVMWLYEKHGIWVDVVLSRNRKQFTFMIQSLGFDEDKFLNEYYNSPTEAYEAAIIYTLKILI